MKFYEGQSQNDLLRGGGRYVEETRTGHEVCNFVSANGQTYGYVQAGKERDGRYQDGAINVERLGGAKGESVAHNITVIWTATHPLERGSKIVGWYRHASVYRKFQRTYVSGLHAQNGITGYWIAASSPNCVLLPEEARNFDVPRMRPGFPGISPLWYADSRESAVLVSDALSYISSYYELDTALTDLDYEIVGNSDPARALSIGYRFKRDGRVRLQVLQRAEGKCEYCGEQGFQLPDGTHYLEAHHIISLGMAGPDTLDNVIAVCPNHHREAHFGINRVNLETAFIEKLKGILCSTS